MKVSQGALELSRKECERIVGSHVGINAVVLSSIDGFDLVSAMSKAVDPKRIAAMSSSISAIGSVVSKEASIGNSEAITVKTDIGFAYFINVEIDNQLTVLCAICEKSAVLAQVIYECNKSRINMKKYSA